MGYSYYLAQIDKKKADSYVRGKDKTFLEKVYGDGTWVYFPDIAEQQGLYDFGDADKNLVDGLMKDSVALFVNPSVQEDFEENPVIINKEALLFAIEYYRQKTVDFYNSLLSDENYEEVYKIPPRKSCEERVKHHIRTNISNWANFPPYSLNEEIKNIVDSSYFEYCIFELVRILKYVDWDNNYILFYGH